MKILLIGASGTIGKAIAEAIEEKGHEVIAVSRKTEPYAVDISNADELKTFLTTKLEGPVDHIICTGGGVHFGTESIDELTDEQIFVGINSKMMGQVNLIRHGYKKINKGGSILITGGIIAYKPIFPKTAHVGMINSALNGYVIGAASELTPTSGVRINVIHPPLVKETAKMFGAPEDGLPDAKETASCYLKCLLEETGTGQEYFLPGHNGKE